MLVCEQIAHGSPAYADACALRNRILRVPLGMELRPQDVAGEEDHLHFVARDDMGTIIATVIFKPFSATHLKLRQMAVDQGMQGKNIGAQLIRFAEETLIRLGYHSLETSARQTAAVFYEKLGYRSEGVPYEEVGLAHIRMTKLLA